MPTSHHQRKTSLMPPTNLERATIARVTLDAFMAQTGDDGIENAITDLVSDIGHLCDAKKLDFVRLMEKAIGDWKLEQTDANSCHPCRCVRIEVEP